MSVFFSDFGPASRGISTTYHYVLSICFGIRRPIHSLLETNQLRVSQKQDKTRTKTRGGPGFIMFRGRNSPPITLGLYICQRRCGKPSLGTARYEKKFTVDALHNTVVSFEVNCFFASHTIIYHYRLSNNCGAKIPPVTLIHSVDVSHFFSRYPSAIFPFTSRYTHAHTYKYIYYVFMYTHIYTYTK